MTRVSTARYVLALVFGIVSLALLGCGKASPAASSSDPFARVAVGRAQRLTLRDATGQEQSLVTTPPNSFPTSPTFSPDGSKIAFVQSVPFFGDNSSDWGGDIYIVPAAGGTPQLLRKHAQPGDEVFGMAWTPDGSSLYLGHHVTPFVNGAFRNATQQIERLDIAAGTSAVVVPNGVYPTLSRDGSLLAYLTNDPDTGQGGIWVSDANGQNAKELVQLGSRFPAILYPRLSPDGATVAFSAPPGQPTPTAERSHENIVSRLLAGLLPQPVAAHGLPMDVWTVSVANATPKQLTHLSADDPCVTWSRDGTFLEFIATGGMYTVAVDGSNLKKVGIGEFNGNIDNSWAAGR